MAAKIGILGESTAVGGSNTDVTIYTVPSDKAARIKILFMMEGPAGTDGIHVIVRIGSPGKEKMITWDGSALNADTWTGMRLNSTPNPPLAMNAEIGVMDGAAELGDMDGDNSEGHKVVCPLDETWFLSTGDTVVYMWAGGIAYPDALIQVVGVEDDA